MRILVPKPITQKYELFPGSGWGLTEAGLIAAGLAGAFLMFGLTSLIGLPVPVRLMAAVLVAAVGAGLALPVPGQAPLYQLLMAWRTYRQRPTRYLYDWTASDWETFSDDT